MSFIEADIECINHSYQSPQEDILLCLSMKLFLFSFDSFKLCLIDNNTCFSQPFDWDRRAGEPGQRTGVGPERARCHWGKRCGAGAPAAWLLAED